MRVSVIGSVGRAIVIGALGVSLASGARAAGDDQEALLKRGVELRRQGKGEEALEVFQHAAAIKQTPRVMAQLGLAEQAVGLWVRAEEHIKVALQGRGDAWIQKNRRPIEDALKTVQGHLGSLEVWGNPAGAEVIVDGHRVGALPSSGTVRMPVGEAKIVVRKEGYLDMTRVVQIVRRDLMRESVDLHRQPRAPIALDPAPPPPPPPGGEPSSRSTLALADKDHPALLRRDPGQGVVTSDERSPIYRRWWLWTLVGAAVVGVGTAGYLFTHRPTTTAQTLGCDPSIPSCTDWRP